MCLCNYGNVAFCNWQCHRQGILPACDFVSAVAFNTYNDGISKPTVSSSGVDDDDGGEVAVRSVQHWFGDRRR